MSTVAIDAPTSWMLATLLTGELTALLMESWIVRHQASQQGSRSAPCLRAG